MTKKRKRCAPEQIVRKIQDADYILAEGDGVAAILKELNFTEATYYRWRNHYGCLKAEDAKKLKQLEKQNLALKRLLPEAELEKAVSKELAEVVPEARPVEVGPWFTSSTRFMSVSGSPVD